MDRRQSIAPITLITSLALLAGAGLVGPWLVPAPARAEADFRARVVSIGDGDTIRVRRGEQLWTIRLACIDAPEMAQVPNGERARRYLQTRLPLDHDVTIHPLSTDRYGLPGVNYLGGSRQLRRRVPPPLSPCDGRGSRQPRGRRYLCQNL